MMASPLTTFTDSSYWILYDRPPSLKDAELFLTVPSVNSLSWWCSWLKSLPVEHTRAWVEMLVPLVSVAQRDDFVFAYQKTIGLAHAPSILLTTVSLKQLKSTLDFCYERLLSWPENGKFYEGIHAHLDVFHQRLYKEPLWPMFVGKVMMSNRLTSEHQAVWNAMVSTEVLFVHAFAAFSRSLSTVSKEEWASSFESYFSPWWHRLMDDADRQVWLNAAKSLVPPHVLIKMGCLRIFEEKQELIKTGNTLENSLLSPSRVRL